MPSPPPASTWSSAIAAWSPSDTPPSSAPALSWSAPAPVLGAGASGVVLLAVEGFRSAWLAWPAAIGVAALAALVIGAMSLRTRGVYFIMITLAFAQMIYYIFVSLKSYGGDDGLSMPGRSTI